MLFALNRASWLTFLCCVSVVAVNLLGAGQVLSKPHSEEEIRKRLAEVEEILQKDPHNVTALESKVAGLSLLGRRHEALRLCEDSIKLKRDSGFFWFFRGYCKFKESKWKEALTYLDMGYRYGYLEGADLIPVCLLELGQSKQCIEFTSKAICKEPSRGSLYYHRGLARMALKLPMSEICLDLEKASNLDARFSDSYRRYCLEAKAE